MPSNSNMWRAGLFAILPIAIMSILVMIIGMAYADTNSAPQTYILRRVEIWNLFYRGMVAAFVVGALVQGAIVYVAWKFRESNKKTFPSETPPEDELR
jgi:heme/copper-type cytochrome/quinol oxidase subunit 2